MEKKRKKLHNYHFLEDVNVMTRKFLFGAYLMKLEGLRKMKPASLLQCARASMILIGVAIAVGGFGCSPKSEGREKLLELLQHTFVSFITLYVAVVATLA